MSNPYVGIGRRKRKKSSHAEIYKGLIRDNTVSWRARMIVVYLLSHGDDWQVRFSDLKAQGLGGNCSLRAAFAELREAGYARLLHLKDPKTGDWKGTRWFVSDDNEGTQALKTAACDKERLNTSYLRNTKSRPQGRAGVVDSLGLENKADSHATKFTKIFARYAAEKGLHVGQDNAHETGWNVQELKYWNRSCQRLLLQCDNDVNRIRTVMRWYFDHVGEEFVPMCHTLKEFCRKFLPMEAAMKRIHRNGQPHDDDDEPGELVTDADGLTTVVHRRR